MTTGRTRMAVMVALLALTLPACGRERAPAPPPEEKSTGATALPDSSAQLLALVPASNEVAGWLAAGKPRFFSGGNLWEFIDGAAEGYLNYGFQEVVSADFSQDTREITVDVYRMKDDVNAFGIYTQERNPTARLVPVGVEGSVNGSALRFWSGPYYVKLTGFDDQAETLHAMQQIASCISGKIGAPGPAPAEIGWFPAENQVARSVAYVPKDVLGQSYFSNAFEARYTAGRAEYRVLVIDLQDAAAAAKAFAAYRQFVAGSGKAPTALAAQGSDEGFTGTDRFYGLVMAVRSGRYVVIALGAPSPAAGSTMVKQVLGRIPR